MWTQTRRRAGRLLPRADVGAITVSRVALLALTAGFGLAALAGTTPGLRAQMAAYLFGMVALNLPHGGYEHLENLRHHGLPFGARYVAAYLAVVAGFVALFFLRPVVALAVAFATAVAKGGGGDLRVLDAVVGSDHLATRPQRALAAFVRGGAVMIVPLVFWTGTYYTFSTYMLSLFDPGAVAGLWGQMETGAVVLGGLYAVAVVAHLGLGYWTGGLSASWLTDVGETALLIAYFAVVPVVVSIGLYFPLWYSTRQTGRVVAVTRDEPRDGLSAGAAIALFTAGAITTGAVAALLWVVVPNPLANAGIPAGLVAFYTIFICIVALPHVVVGEWLDTKRGIWYVP